MSTPPLTGKIINHACGQGAVDVEDVQQRARELARINGRAAADYSENDWVQAKYELQGGHLGSVAAELEDAGMSIGPDMIAGSLGRHVPNHSVDESENAVTELIQEGLEEAEHEQMLAARGNDVDEED